MKFITQAAKVLNEQKKYKRRLAVFLCLAVVVALGTAAALKMYGLAMSHKQKKLVCRYAAHVHTDGCFDAEKAVCGYADYAVHLHNDDCYGPDGELVCRIPEAEAHVHTEECYTEQEVLICEEEGTLAHEHTESCYIPERGELLCQIEEHMHEDSCYGENGEIICPLEEHQHDDNCYEWKDVLTCTLGGHEHTQDCYTREMRELSCTLEDHEHEEACYDGNGELLCQTEEHAHDDACYNWEDVLTCQLEENGGGHEHGDGCFEMQKVLSCGKLELHTHDDSCCDENGALVCGLLQLEEHVHGEDCFETVELTEEEILALTGDEEETVSEDAVSEDSVSVDKAESEAHEHTDECYDADGMLICEYKEDETEEPPIIKTYKDENYIVTASYHNDAEIPEDAELKAEMITSETDGEHYAEREAEIRKTLENEDLTMNALLKIGFYKDNEEIEPKSDVTLTVQFLDEKGLAEGSPIAVVHFSDGGSQVLSGGEAKNKSTTFKTKSFSEFGIIEGYKVEEPEKPDSGTGNSEEPAGIPVAQTYEYQNDACHITFHISGNAVLLEDKDDTAKIISFGDEDEFIDVEDTSVSEDENAIKDIPVLTESENSTDENETVSENDRRDEKSNAEDELSEETEASDEIQEGSESADENPRDESVLIKPEKSDENSDFNLMVSALAEDSVEHMAAQEYMDEEADKLTAQSEQLMLQTISYSLMYKGMEMDLAGCEIEAEITPAETLLDQAEKETGGDDQISVAFTVMGVSKDNEVSEVDTICLENKKAIKPLRFNIPSSIKMLSTGANARTNADPKYKVEYYAYVKVPVTTQDDPTKKPALELINTDNGGKGENGRLPQNNTTKIGNTTIDNNGVIRLKMDDVPLVEGGEYSIQYESKLMKIFESEEFNFVNYPQLKYVNKFKYKVKTNTTKPEEPELNPDPHYDLSEIWVDSSGDSNENDNWPGWNKLSYEKEGDREITNNAGNEDQKHILINELENGKKPVIRFVCKYNNDRLIDPVDFYDYDISDGNIYGSKEDATKKTNPLTDRGTNQTNIYMNIAQEGINKDNYGIRVGDYATQTGARFGFGNGMNGIGVVWDNCKFNGYSINQGNKLDGNGNPIANIATDAAQRAKVVYGICSFGLVQNELKNGYPAFTEGIYGPDLFSPKDEPGKKRVTGYSLDFSRAGDTYVLSGLYNSEAPQGGQNNLTGLDQFKCTTKKQWTFKTPVYSNSFWPMDFSKTYNITGHDYKFGSGKDIRAVGKNPSPPTDSLATYVSDEKIDHNSFFGMTFSVNFELTRDYCGLLDYYFFGDDDMWVYLIKKPDEKTGDQGWSKLVCDIGGVHSAVGEYVNLWDWIKKGKVGEDGREGQYALKFFYTERGASGSTCWMQYTLPSASIQPVDQSEEQDQLTVKKTVENLTNPGEEFEFKITLHAGTGNRYPYVIKNESGKQVGSGNIADEETTPIKLQHNQQVTIMYLPKGAGYTVVETTPRADVFEKTEFKINNGQLNQGYEATGNLKDNEEDIVEYINTARNYELPETGGTGNLPVYTAVLALAGVALLLGYRQSRCRKEEMNRRR